MSSNLTPEQRDAGKRNFEGMVGHQGLTRRTFMKGLLAAGTVAPISAAIYFGYDRLRGKAVKVGLIGAGDQGGVLVGEHNPEFLHFIAYCDPRPSNQRRIFEGEPSGPRKGLERIYGKDARRDVRRYDSYQELLQNKDIEAVIIAVPLHLHAAIAIDALRAGKHVFCEKLMAWNVEQCKEMIRAAESAHRVLAIGHQRHYSMLYAHVLETLDSLGTIKHIRTCWHRNNALPLLDAQGREQRDPNTGLPLLRDGWRPAITDVDRTALTDSARTLGYRDVEELVRWRLYHRTSGGLMAELGSHLLDACGMFLGGARPLAVTGYGGKIFYRDDREIDDHVFATLEYPGPGYYDADGKNVRDASDMVVVTLSSITTNASEPYGETLFGTNATMIVEAEQQALLFPERGSGPGKWTSATVTTAEGGKPILEASASVSPNDRAAMERGKTSLGSEISKGYREELEHFAFCVRSGRDPRIRPRCDGLMGLQNAVVALTANKAMRSRARIEFQPGWFDPISPDAP